MATKNCPKCDSANPVACKKCACGHVFFTSRRSANAVVEYEELPEPSPPPEQEAPRRRTGRAVRERPQFYDALQVENQTRRQKELQKKQRKASKSDEVDASPEDIVEKVHAPATRKRHESPPAKAAVEPPVKKRRGRPPGLTNRRGRAQILPPSRTSDSVAKTSEPTDHNLEDDADVGNIHDVSPVKVLQMNMVLSDINNRISSSSVRADTEVPATETSAPSDDLEDEEEKMVVDDDSQKLDTSEEKIVGIKEEPKAEKIIVENPEDVSSENKEDIKEDRKEESKAEIGQVSSKENNEDETEGDDANKKEPESKEEKGEPMTIETEPDSGESKPVEFNDEEEGVTVKIKVEQRNESKVELEPLSPDVEASAEIPTEASENIAPESKELVPKDTEAVDEKECQDAKTLSSDIKVEGLEEISN